MTEHEESSAIARVVDGIVRGKRRWIIGRERNGEFFLFHPVPGGCLVRRLPSAFQFSMENRRLLIGEARMVLAANRYGVGHA